MSISHPITEVPQIVTITQHAVLCISTRADLKTKALDAIQGGAKQIVIDFHDCLDIDTSGFGCLISIRKHAHDHNVTLILRDVDTLLRDLFRIHNLDSLFTFENTGRT